MLLCTGLISVAQPIWSYIDTMNGPTTLRIGTGTIRILDIDAPEAGQCSERGGGEPVPGRMQLLACRDLPDGLSPRCHHVTGMTAFRKSKIYPRRRKWGASPTKHNRLPAKSLAQISVASDNDKASSTSTPR